MSHVSCLMSHVYIGVCIYTISGTSSDSIHISEWSHIVYRIQYRMHIYYRIHIRLYISDHIGYISDTYGLILYAYIIYRIHIRHISDLYGPISYAYLVLLVVWSITWFLLICVNLCNIWCLMSHVSCLMSHVSCLMSHEPNTHKNFFLFFLFFCFLLLQVADLFQFYIPIPITFHNVQCISEGLPCAPWEREREPHRLLHYMPFCMYVY